MSKIKFITLEKLLELMANKENFKLVEVLPEKNYQEGHLPGAINLPLTNLQELATKYLDKKETIVVYCASYACHASTLATELLLKLGYQNTFDFKGSKKLWVDAGLKLETENSLGKGGEHL